MLPPTLALGFTLLLPGAIASSSTPPSCKAHPSSASWPSHTTWSALNTTISGRLFAPEPPGAVCHRDHPAYNEERCREVQEAWKTYDFHVRDPVSLIANQWVGWSCLPQMDDEQGKAEESGDEVVLEEKEGEMPIVADETDPARLELRNEVGDKMGRCRGDAYPAYVVNASLPQHVKAAVDFARENEVRLVVRSTGHDMMGRSTAPGSLSIWTRYLNSIEYHEGHFELAGSGKKLDGDAMTAGAGTHIYELYKEADRHNRVILGGGAKSVSLGGFVTGGGHGILSLHYGLAADNVLQMEMVTPQGEYLTLNEDQNQDLFWAMRGGGGSTFGVLTSVTVKTHPQKKLDHVFLFAYTKPDTPMALELVTWMLRKVPYLQDSGLSGYLWASKSTDPPVPLPDVEGKVAGFVGATILLDPESPDAVDNALKPLQVEVAERWKGKAVFFYRKQSYNTFLEWFDVNFDNWSAGNSAYLVSRLLDRETLEDREGKLTEVVENVLATTWGIAAYMVAGKGVIEAKPAGGSNAVHPAWRKALLHTLTWEGIPVLNETAKEESKKRLDDVFEPVRKLTPGGGSYINEGHPWEKDWQDVFWGENYERLLKIKREVDPTDVFWCVPCVGNEGWAEVESDEGRRLCRVD